jgi:hypothetical protein
MGGELYLCRQLGPQFIKHVLRIASQTGSIAQKCEGASTLQVGNCPGHGKDLAVLLEGAASRNQCPRTLWCFGDDHSKAKTADDAIAAWERARRRFGPQGKFRKDHTVIQNAIIQGSMGRRIYDIGATAKHGSREPRLESAGVSSGIDAKSQTADNGDAARCQITAETACYLAAVGCTTTRANNGDARRLQSFDLATDEQIAGWVGNLTEQIGISRIVESDEICAKLISPQ